MRDTKELKQELLDKFDIKSDRDLVKQLGIKDEDKAKLYLWITYQCAYTFNEGWERGQERLKEQLTDLIKPKNYFD